MKISALRKAQELERFIETDKDRQLIEAILGLKDMRKVAQALQTPLRTTYNRLESLEKRATRFGYAAIHPESSLKTDMPARGRSYYQKVDPALNDGVSAIWHKTRTEDVTLAQLVKAACEGLNVSAADPRPKPLSAARDDFFPVLTLADAHLGLLAHAAETGDESNLELQIEELKGIVDFLVDEMPRRKEGAVANLGDFFHVDGISKTTRKSGNQLDADKYMMQVSRAGTQLFRYMIDRMLDKVDTVHAFLVPGNHDPEISRHLCEKLQLVYEYEPRVIIPDNDDDHLTHVWKDNFIVMTHGDGGSNQQAYNYITARWAQECGKASYIFVMKGHFHREKSENIGNMILETFSPYTKSDKYHAGKMYKSLRSVKIVTLHASGFEFSRHSLPGEIVS